MNDLTKKYYKISEVADIIGIPPSTLRFWESQFTIVKPHRNAKGTRYYTPKDVETIRMVYFLVKEKGLRLDAAQEELKRNHTGISRRFQAIERLREVRATLQQMLDSLYVRR
ncbi:MAG: MerR family transcriptional regulator [Bacteroidales bacterium]|nr:MerR family transcriptional regulator [Bacteroidales bacterium]